MGGNPIEADQKVEINFIIVALVSQLTRLTIKIFEVKTNAITKGSIYLPT